MARFTSSNDWVKYHGEIPYADIQHQYKHADLGIFASSCESSSCILIENMASGLPIACSNRGPMPEVLQEGGVYFDPEKPIDISRALREMIISTKLRNEKTIVSYQLAENYSWERCANETFAFLSEVANQSQ